VEKLVVGSPVRINYCVSCIAYTEFTNVVGGEGGRGFDYNDVNPQNLSRDLQ
jgi:hypothetical protein